MSPSPDFLRELLEKIGEDVKEVRYRQNKQAEAVSNLERRVSVLQEILGDTKKKVLSPYSWQQSLGEQLGQGR